MQIQSRRIWRTRDGTLVPIRFMTDRHIRHSIAKIEREQWRMEYLETLKEELERRKTQPPTPEEAVARIIGEARDAQWREENQV